MLKRSRRAYEAGEHEARIDKAAWAAAVEDTRAKKARAMSSQEEKEILAAALELADAKHLRLVTDAARVFEQTKALCHNIERLK